MDAQFIVLFKKREKRIQEALDESAFVPRTLLEQISMATKR